MLPNLSRRDTSALELMDDPACDRVMLERTYAQFRFVNAALSGARTLYRTEIKPRAVRGPVRVVDVGCGGADISRRIVRWAQRDRLPVEVVAIDPDPRAIAWASMQDRMPQPALRAVAAADLVEAGERFDVVFSHHVLHHLDATQLPVFLADTAGLLAAGGIAVHRDIARGHVAHIGFAAATALLRQTHRPHSFLREDGLTSIRRSYTPRELARVAPAGWTVRRGFPARLELRSTAGASQTGP